MGKAEEDFHLIQYVKTFIRKFTKRCTVTSHRKSGHLDHSKIICHGGFYPPSGPLFSAGSAVQQMQPGLQGGIPFMGVSWLVGGTGSHLPAPQVLWRSHEALLTWNWCKDLTWYIMPWTPLSPEAKESAVDWVCARDAALDTPGGADIDLCSLWPGTGPKGMTWSCVGEG